jgi:hypothetical protein
MDYIYIAQLNGATVIGVSMLKKSGFVKADNQIVIASLDESLLGKIYDAETGTFKEA